MIERRILIGLALILLLAAAGCRLGDENQPGDSGIQFAEDDDTSDDDTGDDDNFGCANYQDCPDPQVCRDGVCVNPVEPELDTDLAYRRVTNDSPNENLLVHGRLIRPAAHTTILGTFPTDFALSPDGTLLAINENGFGTVVDPDDWVDKRQELRLVTTGNMQIADSAIMPNGSMYVGMTFNAAGNRLYVSGGVDHQLHVFRVGPGATIALDHSIDIPDCYVGDLALTGDGKKLYAACDVENQVALINLQTDQVTAMWAAGSRPIAIALSPDEDRLFIADWAGEALFKSGLAPGDVVTVLDSSAGHALAQIPVGLSPQDLVASADGSEMYVINNKSDDIDVLDVDTLTASERISLHGDFAALKGISPVKAALSPDGGTLYVTGAGENLIDVVDLVTGEVRGSIPTEWYPTDVAVSDDGQTLFVLDGKGRGDGPTVYEGDGAIGENRDQVGRQLFGSVFKVSLPDDATLAQYTQTVWENNHRQSLYFDFSNGNDTALPSPGENRRSPIRHVFFVIKENFSYDVAYGDFERGEGYPDYQLWPAEAMANQWDLARHFTLLDNFYCDSESSIDGHQWAAAGIEPDFVEKNWILDYGGYGMPGIVVSLTPGSIPESQFFMPHLLTHGVSIRAWGGIENFGLGAAYEYRSYINFHYPPLLEQVWLDRDRGDIFRNELAKRIEEDRVPEFSWIFLPNNHAFGLHTGVWTPASWVADNDEGVGKVVDAIANSPIWEDSIVIIFEDDAQHGFDHVDKHRCPALVVGPYVKRNYTSHAAYSMPNLHKTIETIFGVPPMHRWDDLATPMYDVFTARPDTTPWHTLGRVYPEEVYEGGNAKMEAWSARMDWNDIDQNPEAAEFYWRLMRDDEPPAR